MKIQIVNPPDSPHFLVITAENDKEKDQLEELLDYEEILQVEADPKFKVTVHLTEK